MGRFSVAQGTIEQIEPIAANFVSSGVGQLLSNGWAMAGQLLDTLENFRIFTGSLFRF